MRQNGYKQIPLWALDAKLFSLSFGSAVDKDDASKTRALGSRYEVVETKITSLLSSYVVITHIAEV